jgi:hypothetical protein
MDRKGNPMKKYAVVLLVVLLFGAALASEKMMVAYCAIKEGCTFWLSDLTAAEADIVLGTGDLTARNPKGTIVFVKKNGVFEYLYLDTKRSRKELDRLYGGAGNSEIVLFPFGTEIQPQDGRWTVKFGGVRVNPGCPNSMRPSFEKGLSQVPVQSGNKKFSKPFKPTDLLDAKEVRWIKLSANKYRAHLNLGTGGVFKVFFDYTVVSTSKVKAIANITIRIPSVGTCNATAEYQFTRG